MSDRVLVGVTGAAGSLGAGVVRRLVDAGTRTVAIDIAPGPWGRGAGIRRADVRDPLLSRVLDGVGTLVHLAGLHSPGAPPVERRAVNVRGTANVLVAAATAGVSRLVVVTSAMVYGALPDNPVPLTEDAPLRAPRDDSLVGDFVEIERLVAEHRASGARPSVVVLRPVTLVGRGADSVLSRHFEAPRLLVVRGSSPRWQFCHLSDLETAIVIAAEGRIAGDANVSPPGSLTQAEVEAITGLRRLEVPSVVAIAAAERLHRARVTPAPPSDLAYLQHPWVVSPDRLLEAGWKPEYDHESALREQLALAAPGLTLVARRLGRGDASAAAAGATVALLGTAAIVRRARRRRR